MERLTLVTCSQCVFIHTRHRRKLSCRKSHQEIPIMDKCPAIAVWKQLFSQKKMNEFGIAIATTWFINVFQPKYMNNAVLIDIAFITV